MLVTESLSCHKDTAQGTEGGFGCLELCFYRIKGAANLNDRLDPSV